MSLFKMMKINMLIWLFTSNVGLAIGIMKAVQHFVVERDKIAKSHTQLLFKSLKKSAVSCAAQCSVDVGCCSASFDKKETSCTLYTCCFPETVNATGHEHLRKIPTADIVASFPPKDCSELPLGSDNGIYTIQPTNFLHLDVFCDMRLQCNIGWTVVQRRIDGTTNFNVNWGAYKAGFGDVSNEYWIGNDNLNVMTTSKNYTLRFDMEDASGSTAYAEYTLFRVEDESTQYRLAIGGYKGTAGDSADGTYSLNGIKFTSLDRDNDDSSNNCAADSRKGAWWFRDCARVNPNGMYMSPGHFGPETIYWREFRGFTALKSISMKIMK